LSSGATEDEANIRDMDETVCDVTLEVKSCQMAVALVSPELEMRSGKNIGCGGPIDGEDL
jgi:spore maturation protein CgeB